MSPDPVDGAAASRRTSSSGPEPTEDDRGLSLPVRDSLLAAGWRPGRRVDITDTVDRLTHVGYPAGEPFRTFMAEFRGLEIQPALSAGPNFMNDEPYWITPNRGVRYRDEARLLNDLFGEEHDPVGWWLSSSHVFMSTGGRVRAHLDGLIWDLGETPLAALEFAVRPTRPLLCTWSAPGRTPWPKRT
ncbi:SUKH-3 domain-containing protein [Streptomyces sp. 4F14]|uniref:SUKH-3 domain-containing protein n=1 Tax=Streptomyces sp. 4F14 TaxID=3394380 RepID=UPI003A849205